MTTGQSACILGCEGLALTATEAAFFAQARPFGFILFARNIAAPDQLRRLTGDLRAAVGHDAPIAIDQEGGRVQRMAPPHWRQWGPPLDQVAHAPQTAARGMWLRMRLIAAELRAVGLDMNCAPVADIAGPQTHPFLRNRCYGSDVAQVVTMARAAAEGLLAGGVIPVVKHIPGHGRATVDSHKEPPHVRASRAELDQTDFAAFRALNDLPAGMTGHMVFDAIDPGVPTTASALMLGIIRNQIGFDGLLMSDDLGMEALRGTPGQRAGAAIAAGCDLALHCNGDLAEMQQVVAACGGLSAAAQTRAARALALRHHQQGVDIAALEAEFRALS